MPPAPQSPIKIAIVSCPAYLPIVRAAVEQLCRLVGFDTQGAGSVALAVDEALANVIKHAYHGREDGPIDVTLTPLVGSDKTQGLEVVVQDRGRVVATESIRSRDLSDVRPGGLGVHIMNCCMNTVEYSHPPEGGTRLRMVKCLSSTPSEHSSGELNG